MRWYKVVGYILLALLVLFLLFAVWYKNEYSMEKVQGYEINTMDFNQKLLIATQGSAFKDEITQAIIDRYEAKAIFIKVVDIADLPEVDATDFNALVLIHTWENWEPPAVVRTFIENTKSSTEKLVVVTTSGEGSYHMEGVDAITGASKLEEVPLFVDKVIAKLDPLLLTKE